MLDESCCCWIRICWIIKRCAIGAEKRSLSQKEKKNNLNPNILNPVIRVDFYELIDILLTQRTKCCALISELSNFALL